MSLKEVSKVEEVQEICNKQRQYRPVFRSFYKSKTEANNTRFLEIQSKKYWHKVCSSERWFVRKQRDTATKAKPIMFIGDRGIGVGSRIKKRLRYGGTWKQKLHRQETHVCTPTGA
ncbi:hypothetical protein RMATCC62417_16392 [Rhizopus microsporus]|nr:hypothetical protein RMATCC62417_16392 [Rhizopus microsporus]